MTNSKSSEIESNEAQLQKTTVQRATALIVKLLIIMFGLAAGAVIGIVIALATGLIDFVC